MRHRLERRLLFAAPRFAMEYGAAAFTAGGAMVVWADRDCDGSSIWVARRPIP